MGDEDRKTPDSGRVLIMSAAASPTPEDDGAEDPAPPEEDGKLVKNESMCNFLTQKSNRSSKLLFKNFHRSHRSWISMNKSLLLVFIGALNFVTDFYKYCVLPHRKYKYLCTFFF